MLALTEAVRHIGVDVDLAQDVVAAPDQHDQLRFGERVAREIIPPRHRIHVRDILIPLFRDRRAAHAFAYGNPRMLGVAPGMGFELQLVAMQHVGIDGAVGGPQAWRRSHVIWSNARRPSSWRCAARSARTTLAASVIVPPVMTRAFRAR